MKLKLMKHRAAIRRILPKIARPPALQTRKRAITPTPAIFQGTQANLLTIKPISPRKPETSRQIANLHVSRIRQRPTQTEAIKEQSPRTHIATAKDPSVRNKLLVIKRRLLTRNRSQGQRRIKGINRQRVRKIRNRRRKVPERKRVKSRRRNRRVRKSPSGRR